MYLRNILLGLLLAGIGCTKAPVLSPEPVDILKAYIDKSFNIRNTEDRKTLEGYLTGDVKKRLEAWSDEQFKKAFVGSKRKFAKMAIKETQSVSPSEVTITYEIAYQDEGEQHRARVTNKKMSYLQKMADGWKIREVKNLKELIEYQDEMSLP